MSEKTNWFDGETFTEAQTIDAVKSFLEYGEREFGRSHQGTFSSDGWTARCLRSHLKDLQDDD